MELSLVIQGLIAIPVAVGSIYALLTVAAVLRFSRRRTIVPQLATWPGVTILKPVCGLEKGLEENLRSVCEQDYGSYQVVLSVQQPDDPALPLLRRLEAEYGRDRVTVAVASGPSASSEPRASNGKILNLSNAEAAAQHEILVISDSDVEVRPDYLRAIVPPVLDPEVGFACTIYRGVRAGRWYEKLEALSLHDFIVNVIFASSTGASGWCLGSSMAFRRSTLKEIGGFEPLGEYLVEDFEMGRRIWEQGFELRLVPHTVDVVVDLESPRAWWSHQLYWDLNTRMARLKGFLAHALVRSVPFAFLLTAVRLFDPLSLLVLFGAIALRLLTSAANLALLREGEGLRNLYWLPVRDMAAMGTWLVALVKRRVSWRGADFELTRDGRMVPIHDRQGRV